MHEPAKRSRALSGRRTRYPAGRIRKFTTGSPPPRNPQQPLKDLGERVQGNHIRPVAGGRFRRRMRFEEQAIRADGRRGPSQRFDHFAIAAGAFPSPPGSWTLWVASKMTGGPRACICGMARMSLTSRP